MPVTHTATLRLALGLFAASLELPSGAGGSGCNTIVVINRASAASCEIGNHYAEVRGIPPANVLPIRWPGSNVSWTTNDFQTHLVQPLLQAIAERGLSSQVQFVVLSADIPYRVMQGSIANGTTSALFYGFKENGGPFISSYFRSEAPIENFKPSSATDGSFLATLLTADSVDEAKALVTRSAAADGTFPADPVILAKSSDPTRNIRSTLFGGALLDGAVLNRMRIYQTNVNVPYNNGKIFGLQTGLASYSIPGETFAPGAIADSLTSFGGALFESTGQTSLLEMLQAGASGSYGTVAEPSAELSRFPHPQVYFYQARGFSLGEAYYQSLKEPHLGIIVGDPLCAPYRRNAVANWSTTNKFAHGLESFGVRFHATAFDAPLQKVDLFLNGLWTRTVTNLPPAAGNVIELNLNGYPLSCTVPPEATVASLAAEVAFLINTVSNSTKVLAVNHGDRVELRSWATNQLSRTWFMEDLSGAVVATTFYRATYLPDPIPPLLRMSRGFGGPKVDVRSPGGQPYRIEASTDLVNWQPIYTNLIGTEMSFADPESASLDRRFYRVAATYDEPQPPSLRIIKTDPEATVVEIQGEGSSGFTLEASDDLDTWTPLSTNAQGGTLNFRDDVTNLARRFYRTAPIHIPQPVVSALTLPGYSNRLIQVENAMRPYRVESSTNLRDWTVLSTNLLVNRMTLEARTLKGTANSLTTRAWVPSPEFVHSMNRGSREVRLGGAVHAGSYLGVSYWKTNGASGSVIVTNDTGSSTHVLAQALAQAVNADGRLNGLDGLEVSDVFENFSGSVSLILSARAAGCEAAAIRLRMIVSAGLLAFPGSTVSLDAYGASDLQPRNHVYLGAGLSDLPANFELDTETLPDGYHELAAVATEGTHVRTQTRAAQHIIITNTPLWANLSLASATTNLPMSLAAHLSITANTHSVKRIQLFSTGGGVGETNGVSNVRFEIAGTNLGLGLHPFYALVETTNGWTFRTQTRYVRFTKDNTTADDADGRR